MSIPTTLGRLRSKKIDFPFVHLFVDNRPFLEQTHMFLITLFTKQALHLVPGIQTANSHCIKSRLTLAACVEREGGREGGICW